MTQPESVTSGLSAAKDFFKKIAAAMQDEEVDIYALSLFCMSADDMQFFSEADRARVKEIFNILIEDTKIHSQLLKEILESGENR